MNEILQALLGAVVGSGLVSVIVRFGLTRFIDALSRIPEQEWFDRVTFQLEKMPTHAWFDYANKQLSLIPELPTKANLDLLINNVNLTVNERNGLEDRVDDMAVELRNLRHDVDELMKNRV